MPYQASRWRQVFQASVATRSPRLDAVALEALRDFQRAAAHCGVIGAVDGAFDRARDDFLGAMDRGVVDNPVTQQRPVLHQSKHTAFLQRVLSLAAGIHGIAMNFSAEKASRKWPCGGFCRPAAAMVTAAAAADALRSINARRRGDDTGTLGRAARGGQDQPAPGGAVGAAAETAPGRGAQSRIQQG